MSLSGGCQCGAVRFTAAKVGGSGICHCRMCQKAFGAAFGPLVTVLDADLIWTRGQPKIFQSSNVAHRGFCADCGTPLTYVGSAGETEVALGAFDDPNAVAPDHQNSHETRLAWFDGLPGLRARPLSGWGGKLVSFQHPDHDTTEWPPQGSRPE